MSFRRYFIAATIVCVALSAVLFIKPKPIGHAKGRYSGIPCDPHTIPDSLCTRCHPDLVALFKERHDWCAEHKLPESQCYLCNPELANTKLISNSDTMSKRNESNSSNAKQPAVQVKLDWCIEHRVPESECTNCKPELEAAFKTKGDWCGSHGVPESHCYQCNPNLKFPQEADYERRKQEDTKPLERKPQTSLYRTNAIQCSSNDAVIQLASIESASRSGIEFSVVGEVPSVEQIEAPGETGFVPTASSILTSLATGTLVKWAAVPGDRVVKGQVVAWLESDEGATHCANFSSAKSLLKLSESDLKRKRELSLSNLISTREILEAESEHERVQIEYRRAQAALAAIGFSEEDMARIGTSDSQSSLIQVRARQSGTLIEYKAELGSVIHSGEALAQVADIRELWITARLRVADLPKVRVGQKATVSADGNALQRESGKVIWISDAIDQTTRSASVRIHVLRNGSNLRAGQFVRVKIESEAVGGKAVVPESAVQWEGCCNVVFIAETNDRICPRKVTIEYASDGNYIVTGVEPGLRIVTRGSYILKTELMKEGIGVGCCGVGA